MSEIITSIKVFVASPSDVKNERLILEQVIADLNKLIGKRFNRRLDLVKWETDTSPDVGLDAQSVIDKQIGNDYDVFIGILWTRFGTPTRYDSSGTKVEYTHAYQKATENPNSIKIMMYFNNAPISPDELDTMQLSQIKNFKKSLGEEGIYWWQYNGISDFERFVRLHLGGIMLDFGSKWGKKINETNGNSSPSEDIIEMGKADLNITSVEDVLDLAKLSTDQTQIATESINYMSTFMKDFNLKQRIHTEHLEKLGKGADINKVNANLDNYADDLEDLVIRSDAELIVLSKRFRLGIDLYIKFISFSGKYFVKTHRSLLETNYESMLGVNASVVEAQANASAFRDQIAKLPRRTVKLSKTIDYFLNTWNKIIEEYKAQELLTLEVVKVYKSILA